jgi:hypothetical protein
VDVEHGLELLVCGFLDDRVPGVAGVVDDDVEGAEGGEGGGYEGVRSRGEGEVGGVVAGAGGLGEIASSMSLSMTFAPAARRRWAMARPMPRPEPVTRAVRPWRLMCMGVFSGTDYSQGGWRLMA